MEELVSNIPYVLLPMSTGAALVVVFVAALRTLGRSFRQPTATILAVGVTILALVGTAQIIFVRPQGQESAMPMAPNGNALMLLPFVTLSIASLLAQVLATAGGTVPQTRSPQPQDKRADIDAPAPTTAKLAENAPAKSRPRGRPRKQPRDGATQQLPLEAAAKKTHSPKPPRPTGTDAPAKQASDDTPKQS